MKKGKKVTTPFYLFPTNIFINMFMFDLSVFLDQVSKGRLRFL